MKIEAFYPEEKAHNEFMETLKPFLEVVNRHGLPLTYSGMVSALALDENDDYKEQSIITSIYLYRGKNKIGHLTTEILLEYAQDIFEDGATNSVTIHKIKDYMAVTIIASL